MSGTGQPGDHGRARRTGFIHRGLRHRPGQGRVPGQGRCGLRTRSGRRSAAWRPRIRVTPQPPPGMVPRGGSGWCSRDGRRSACCRRCLLHGVRRGRSRDGRRTLDRCRLSLGASPARCLAAARIPRLRSGRGRCLAAPRRWGLGAAPRLAAAPGAGRRHLRGRRERSVVHEADDSLGRQRAVELVGVDREVRQRITADGLQHPGGVAGDHLHMAVEHHPVPGLRLVAVAEWMPAVVSLPRPAGSR